MEWLAHFLIYSKYGVLIKARLQTDAGNGNVLSRYEPLHVLVIVWTFFCTLVTSYKCVAGRVGGWEDDNAMAHCKSSFGPRTKPDKLLLFYASFYRELWPAYNILSWRFSQKKLNLTWTCKNLIVSLKFNYIPAQTLPFHRNKTPKMLSAKYQKRQFLTLSSSLYIWAICLPGNCVYRTRNPDLLQNVHFRPFQIFPRTSALSPSFPSFELD